MKLQSHKPGEIFLPSDAIKDKTGKGKQRNDRAKSAPRKYTKEISATE